MVNWEHIGLIGRRRRFYRFASAVVGGQQTGGMASDALTRDGRIGPINLKIVRLQPGQT